jgi:hypothetical protein
MGTPDVRLSGLTGGWPYLHLRCEQARRLYNGSDFKVEAFPNELVIQNRSSFLLARPSLESTWFLQGGRSANPVSRFAYVWLFAPHRRARFPRLRFPEELSDQNFDHDYYFKLPFEGAGCPMASRFLGKRIDDPDQERTGELRSVILVSGRMTNDALGSVNVRTRC